MIRQYKVLVPTTGSVRIPSAAAGNYIRCLDSGGYPVDLVLESKEGGTLRVPIQGGLGFDTREFVGVSLEAIELVSTTVTFIISDEGAIHDSRLNVSGTLTTNVGASVGVTYHDIQTLGVVDVGVEVLGILGNRKQAVIQISSDCYVNDSTNGILVSGAFVWESSQALTLVPKSAGCEVRILEETN